MGYVDAFAKYGATLTNPGWSVSGFGQDGCLVVSLWQDLLKSKEVKGALVYRDRLSQWKGNPLGRAELERNFRTAQETHCTIRLVIAHPATLADAALVGKVADESEINKTFSVREDLVGELASFDGDAVCLVFKRAG